MIKLHRLNGSEIVVNAELIETIDTIPDTRIVLTTGNQLIVKENINEVIEKVIKYRQKVHSKEEVKRESLIPGDSANRDGDDLMKKT